MSNYKVYPESYYKSFKDVKVFQFRGDNGKELKKFVGDSLHQYKQDDKIHYVITTEFGDLHVEVNDFVINDHGKFSIYKSQDEDLFLKNGVYTTASVLQFKKTK